MLNCATQSLSLSFKYYRIIKTHNQPSLSEVHYITKIALGRNLPLILRNCHGLIYEYYFLNYWSQIISNLYDRFLINPQIYVIISLQFNKCNYKIYQHTMVSGEQINHYFRFFISQEQRNIIIFYRNIICNITICMLQFTCYTVIFITRTSSLCYENILLTKLFSTGQHSKKKKFFNK